MPSGRTELVANLMSFGDVPEHSYGKCGRPAPRRRASFAGARGVRPGGV